MKALLLALAVVAFVTPAFAQARDQMPKRRCVQAESPQKTAFATRYIYSGCTEIPNSALRYGEVAVRIIPPSDVTDKIAKATSGGFLNFVRRWVENNKQSGVVLLKLTLYSNGVATELRSIPVATFEIKKQGAIDVKESAREESGVVTTIFPVTAAEETYVDVSLNIIATDQSIGQITDRVFQLNAIATKFGGHGWLSTAMADTPLVQNLRQLEQSIWAAAGNYTVESTRTTALRFAPRREDPGSTVWSGVAFDFGIDPRPRASRSGRVEVYLVRRPSLFPSYTLEYTGAPIAYNFKTDEEAFQEVFERSLGPEMSIGQYLARQSGVADSLASLRRANVTETEFQRACDTLVGALIPAAAGTSQAERHGISLEDRGAILWTALRSGRGAVIERRDILQTECISSRRESFARLNLALPPMPAAMFPPQASAILANEGTIKATDIHATWAGNPDQISLRRRKFPGAGPADMEPWTSLDIKEFAKGLATKDEYFSRGTTSFLLRNASDADRIMFVAFLDRDGDGYFDTLDQVIWRAPGAIQNVQKSTGGIRSIPEECEFFLVGVEGNSTATFIACPTGAGWRPPAREGQANPEIRSIESIDGGKFLRSRVVDGVLI